LFKKKNREFTLGSFDPESKRIEMDRTFFDRDYLSARRLLETLEHESRHAWQHNEIELLRAGKLTGWRAKRAKIFQKESENYVDSKSNFEQYASQKIEKDARKAAKTAEAAHNKLTLTLRSAFPNALVNQAGVINTKSQL
jgi:hypothetical protein